MLEIAKGQIAGRSFDRPLEAGPAQNSDPAELDARLQETVAAHQMADVPFGMFLSGGIDSSILLALMTRLNPSPDTAPVLAYTARFPDAPVPDETGLAGQLADECGAQFIDCPYTRADFLPMRVWLLRPVMTRLLIMRSAQPASGPPCGPGCQNYPEWRRGR